ncbi:MAG: tetratricopeptide repeat protein [Campylobacterales bacterium]|nr:tetratricopeptide repeat protein [Campylobacterales bacterium]
MADAQEEIIVIEESDAAGVETTPVNEDVTQANPPPNKKKIILIAAGVATLLLAAGGVAYALLSHSGDEEVFKQEEPLIASKNPKEPKIQPSQLENMIERANYMYTNGNQAEALQLFEKIALYSESISQYNLGVARLKEKEYTDALENFKHAIDLRENRCVSAINAAVCCLNLKQQQNFDHYINLAQTYLSSESTSPMYSYYYALINYYKGNYFEALSALNHPTTHEYPVAQDKIKAAVNTLYGNYDAAIQSLENQQQESDSFSLGLLYANTGDFNKARKYFNSALLQNTKPIQETLSLAYVNLMLGQNQEAGSLLKKVTETYPNDVYTPYPIKVYLKSILFEPDTVQKVYRASDDKMHTQTYPKIFAFTPYKIFNANQTISYIRRGNADVNIDDIASAKKYFKEGAHESNVDYALSLAVQEALHLRLRDANTHLQKLVSAHPKHSILQYNLALTYAQLGDYPKAYTYFLSSYHLDANNYLSGIFAIMTSELISKANPKLISILKENLAQEVESEEFDLYRTLITITENNYLSSSRWLDNRYKDRPLYLMMKIIIAQKLNMRDKAQKASEKLVEMQSSNLLPHLLYIDTHYDTLTPKAYARSSINYLKNKNIGYEDFYFGSQISRERGVMMAAITGGLTPLIQQLEDKLQTTTEDRTYITAGLALAHFYNQDFEESYSLYNQAVDTYNLKDERTLFMAASASIGSEHYQNAIALLQLSKMTNPSYLESRYALGLLYMQVQNNLAAANQFMKMGNEGFQSLNFDFRIDTDKLATEPQLYHPIR